MSDRFPVPSTAPVRTCVGCRERSDRRELLRLVVSPAAPDQAETGHRDQGLVVVPDERQRLPGRGAWIHPRRSCLEQAERRRAFARAFRCSGPFDLAAVLEHLA